MFIGTEDDDEDAAAGYEAFAQENATSPLQPQATFGAARCLVQLGKFDEARVRALAEAAGWRVEAFEVSDAPRVALALLAS